MDILIQILAFIITILVLVSIHEAGHFFVAKLLGVKVLRFSIGFGKPFARFRDKQDTEYVLAYIPLGGYVKLLDEREVQVPDAEKHLTFNRQPLWARTCIILAGPLTNLIFAVLAFWIMFMVGINSYLPIVGTVKAPSIAAEAGLTRGDQIESVDGKNTPSLQKFVMAVTTRLGEKTHMIIAARNIYTHERHVYDLNLAGWAVSRLNPEPLASLGIMLLEPPIAPVIHEVVENSPADQAGIKPFDRILAINNQAIKNWYEFINFTHKNPGKQIAIKLQRGDLIKTVYVTVDSKWGKGFIGVKPVLPKIPSYMLIKRKYPPLKALGVATSETWQLFSFNFIIIKKMILGEISVGSLGGPITIFRSANMALEQGIGVFMGFLALISIMLAFINILPIPGLDGGHLLNNLIEFIIRRPLSLKFEFISIQIGMLILLFIMFLATFNDIIRLWLALHK